MLNQEVAILINEQINKEFYSSYLYLDMAGYYAVENLKGFENWFFVQAQEERDHALLFRTYLLNNDQSVTLPAIAAPATNFKEFSEPLALTLAHEQTVTASINNIYAVALKTQDFRTMQFLDWFIKEQGEEEKNSTELIKKYDLFGKDSKGLYMLDQELGARIYAPPTLVI
jgi:Ferritin-like protein